MKTSLRALASALVLSAAPALLQAQQPGAQQGPQQPMSFFVTSVGKGDGANLGGLTGADAHCDMLARAAGVTNKTWRAYLSTAAAGGQPAGHARDRIGSGPWYNAKGVLIAASVADLHGDNQHDRDGITKALALTEKGQPVTGFGEQGSQHDMLTGSDSHGRALLGNAATATCSNWTSNATGSAMVGHTDRNGPFAGASSWNAAHMTVGCSQQNLVTTGGGGMFYCFAIN